MERDNGLLPSILQFAICCRHTFDFELDAVNPYSYALAVVIMIVTALLS